MINWDKLRSGRMFSGHYKKQPLWSNGYILEFAPPPKELKVSWKRLDKAILADLMGQVEEAEVRPVIGIGGGVASDDRLFFRAGDIYGTVGRYYWEYFQERYPDMEAFAHGAETVMQIKSKGELVGLIMPLMAHAAKENYRASIITELGPLTITELRFTATLAPPQGPHRCRDCAEYSNAYWDFPDNTREGVAACLLGKWPKPHVRKISMVIRNRPPLREIGAKCEMWRPRP